MRRKYLATLAVVTALITSVVPVYADYSKAGDTGSQEISSSFDVSADDFGGLIVSIPNDIPLSYDKVSFGEDGNVEYWTSEECLSGVVQKELGVTVSDLSDIHTGHYSGAITVGVEIEQSK